MKLRNEPTRKGKTIKPQHLNKIFIDCDTQELLNDFENNNIQNDLLNSWEVVYYFDVLNSILTFSIDEYDFIHQSLKSFVRDKKIDEVLKNVDCLQMGTSKNDPQCIKWYLHILKIN